MRRYFHGSVLFLCILALCVSGCGGSGGSAADPMGTATVQFIDEKGAVLFPEEAGSPMVFTVLPGETRQLIVWVTNTRDGGATIVPVIGEKVTFSLLTPGNGGSITMVNNETDGNGRAVALYTAGNNYAMDEVRATTEAGASAQLTILKTGGLVGKQITSLTPSSLSVPDGATSVITALVTDGNGNPVMGETVLFSFTVNASGAYFITASQANVGTFSATTDASGRAQAVYLAGSNSPTLTLYDTVRAALSNGSTQSVMITRSPGTLQAYTLTLTANPSAVTVPYGGGPFDTTITATVVNQSGVPQSNVVVNISDATGPRATLTTGSDGKDSGFFTAPAATSGAYSFIGRAPALNISATTSVIVTEMPAPPSP